MTSENGLPGAVEQLLSDYPNTPAPLAATLRVLARELQRSPARPGLWSRFLSVTERVLDAARPDDDEARQLSHFIRTGCEDPSHVGPVHCSSCCRRRVF